MGIKLILIFVAIVAIIACYVVVQEKLNLCKAASGEDKEQLRKVVAQALPGISGYQVVYGHYEKMDDFGRKAYTTYYYYALAFDASNIWIVPLFFDKELILPGKPVLITSGTLGVADVSITNGKDGKARRVGFTLYDKYGTAFLSCVVEKNNTREDRFHHLNIVQKEECARFGQLMGSIAAQVNRVHAELQEQVHTVQASTRKASILGPLSIVFGSIFPPIGLILSITGIHYAKKGRIGGELIYPLVLCYAGLVVSSIFLLLEGSALIYACLIKGKLGG